MNLRPWVLFAVVCSTPGLGAGSARANEALKDLFVHERYLAAFETGVTTLEGQVSDESLESPAALSTLAWLSRIARHAGDLTASYQISSTAVELARGNPAVDSGLLARLLLERGLCRRLTDGTTAVGEDLQEALGLVETLEGHETLRADIVQAQANWLRSRDREAAVRRYEDALALRRRVPAPDFGTADTLVWLAHACQRIPGHRREAEDALREARSILHQLGLEDHALHGSALSSLSGLALERGDITQSTLWRSESARIQARARDRIFPGYARMRLPVGLELMETVVSFWEGDHEQRWSSYVRAHRQTWQDHRARWEARRQNLPSATRLDEAESEQIRSWSSLRRIYDPLRSPPGRVDGEYRALFVRWLRHVAETLQRWEALLEEVSSQERPVMSLDELQSALDPGQAFLGLFRYGLEPGGSTSNPKPRVYGVLVPHVGEVEWKRLDVATAEGESSLEIATRVRQSMTRASEWPTRVTDDRSLHRRLQELYERWLEPFGSRLERVENLIVCAPEVAVGVPFAALESPDGQRLIDRFQLSFVTSPEAVPSFRREHVDGLRAPRALVLGDPAYSAAHLEPAATNPEVLWSVGAAGTAMVPRSVVEAYEQGDLGALDHLPRLPFSGLEARSVASNYDDVDLRLGPEASEKTLRELAERGTLEQFDVIHVASHALFEPRLHERCALALARVDASGHPLDEHPDSWKDGLVDMTEVASSWQLDADLVVLSGCQTSSTVGGGASPGFVATLLDVGARSVVSSHWKVDDAATALLMRRFYEVLAHGDVSIAEALGRAEIWLRDHVGPDGKRPFAHPVYWASFFLTGDGGAIDGSTAR